MKQYYIKSCKYFAFLLAPWLLLLGLQACKKDKVEAQAPKSPEVTHYYPNSGTAGTLIHIEGKDLDAEGIYVELNGNKLEILTKTADLLVVQVPVGTSSSSLKLRSGSQSTDIGTFTYQALSLTQIWPQNGTVGSQIRLSGTGFGSATDPAEVYINDTKAIIASASDTAMVVIVPASAGRGPVRIKVDGMESVGAIFTYQEITQIKPLTGGTGTQVRIYGPGLQTLGAEDIIDFNGKPAKLIATHPDHIVAEAPLEVETGPLSVTINGQRITGNTFTVVPPPLLYSVSPQSGPAGSIMTIKGVYFSRIAEENKVLINGKTLIPTTVSESEMQVVLPADLGRGEMTLSVNDQKIKGPIIAVQNLGIKKVIPDNGLAGTEVLIQGTGFDPDKNNNKVYFNGVLTPVLEASDIQLKVQAPAGLSTGDLKVTVHGQEALAPTPFRRAGVLTIAGGLGQLLVKGEGNHSIAVDSRGNIYLADQRQNLIKKITPSGTISHYAGSPSGAQGYSDGVGSAARFDMTLGVRLIVDKQDNLWIAENNFASGGSIRKVNLNTGEVATHAIGLKSHSLFVGPDSRVYLRSSIDGFNHDGKMLDVIDHKTIKTIPVSLPSNTSLTPRYAMDTDGAFYTQLHESYSINKFARGSTAYWGQIVAGDPSEPGHQDGIGSQARIGFSVPNIINQTETSLIFSDINAEYDENWNFLSTLHIRQLNTLTREVSTLIKCSERGIKDGDFRDVQFISIVDMAIGPDGSIYVLDYTNAIRKIFLK